MAALSAPAYALASHHPTHAGAPPRGWVLEGSADGGTTWTTLSEHRDDRTIDGSSNFGVWGLSTVEKGQYAVPCSMLRWRVTAPNALGEDKFQVAGVEVYGRGLCCAEGGFDQAPSAYFGDSQPATPLRRPVTVRAPGPMIPEPEPPKRGRKGKKK